VGGYRYRARDNQSQEVEMDLETIYRNSRNVILDEESMARVE